MKTIINLLAKSLNNLKKMKKTSIIAIAFCSMAMSGIAQEFNYQAQVEVPKKDEFHKILLSPEITGRMTRDLADIRIYSDDQRQIPYYVESETHNTRLTGFKNYTIYDRDYQRGWDYQSRYYLKNTEGTKINHIVLKIRNFSDAKRARLSGSDDGRQWFTIKDGYSLHEVVSNSDSYNYKVLHFPLSSYKYYKIEVDDRWHRDPINVMEAGYFTDDLEHGSYQKAITPTLTQTEDRDKKTSRINIKFSHTQWVDKIRFEMNREENFYREAELFVKNYNEDSTFYFDKVQTFWLSSTQLNELRFSKFKCREMELVIHNKDNYPVKITGADAYQLKNYLVADMKKGRQYFVQYGNRQAKKPEYDILYFKNDVPENLRILKTFNEQRLDVFRPEASDAPVVTEGPYLTEDQPEVAQPNAPAEIEEETPFYKSQTFVWICIGVVIVVIGFMSIRMMGEVKDSSGGASEE